MLTCVRTNLSMTSKNAVNHKSNLKGIQVDNYECDLHRNNNTCISVGKGNDKERRLILNLLYLNSYNPLFNSPNILADHISTCFTCLYNFSNLLLEELLYFGHILSDFFFLFCAMHSCIKCVGYCLVLKTAITITPHKKDTSLPISIHTKIK